MPTLILLLRFRDETPLHLSAFNGHIDLCRLLLEFKADVNAKDIKYAPPPLLSLFFFSFELCLRMLILLLFFSRETPLHCCVFIGDFDTTRLLLEFNADVNARKRT